MTKDITRIDRRRFLKTTATVAVGAGALASGVQSAHALQKASKDDVQYQDSPNDGSSCAGCQFFDGAGGCQIVEGDISADAWCIAFVSG